MSTAAPQPQGGRISQMRQAYRLTKQTDKNIGLILLLTFLVVTAVFGVVGWLIMGSGWIGLTLTAVFALLSGILGVLIVFGRRAERSAYAQIEGQPGAAAGALNMMRRGWNVKPAVAVTKNQDVVHRVIGRPGVILVGEGSPTRVRQLITAEKKKHARIVGDEVPLLDVVVGRGDGEVPLPRLTKHLKKLKKTLKPAELTDVINKTKALDAMRPPVPMPKGPMNQNAMRGARKAMRG